MPFVLFVGADLKGFHQRALVKPTVQRKIQRKIAPPIKKVLDFLWIYGIISNVLEA